MLTILATPNLPASRDFYERAFGWPMAVETPNYVEFQVSQGAYLGLMDKGLSARFAGDKGLATVGDGVRPVELYLTFMDAKPVIGRLESLGAECTSPMQLRGWGERTAYYLDPDGVLIGIAEKINIAD